MVQPLFPRYKNWSNDTNLTIVKEYYVQKPPRNVPSPCTIARCEDRLNYGMGFASTWEGSGPYWLADNKARERFVDKLGDKSSFAATLIAERKGTVDMIANRAGQLLRIARDLRRGRFPRPSGPQKVRSSGRETSKYFGGLWLEYSYGWSPLVGDIYNGCDVIQRPPPEFRIKGSGSRSKTSTVRLGSWEQDLMTTSWRCGTTLRARVVVDNPNLWLANQLGLINPATVVWEAIPFSFVIDWFSNASQFLNNCTDFSGLQLRDATTSRLISYEVFHSQWWGGYIARNSKETYFVRRGGIPDTRLVFEYERVQWLRAANAISLLTQFLSDNEKVRVRR